MFRDTDEPLPNVNMGISTSSVKLATLAIHEWPHSNPQSARTGGERERERDGETEKKKHDK